MNTPVASPLSQSITDMSTPGISSLDPGPTYRDLDTKYPTAEYLSDLNQTSPPPADLGTDSSPIIESPPLLYTSVSQAIDSNEPRSNPYPVDSLQAPKHRAIQNLLREHGVDSPPIVSPPITEDTSQVKSVTTADSVEPTKFDVYGDLDNTVAVSDPESELGGSDIVFIPAITTESNSPATPASDLEEYFSNISVSSDEDSADQKNPSKQSLSGTTDWRSLDTVLPASNHPEEVAQEQWVELAKPAMMIISESLDPPSDLDIFDFEELELAPSESPPPSCTPSADFSPNSLVLLKFSNDGSVTKLPFDVVSVDDGVIVVSPVDE